MAKATAAAKAVVVAVAWVARVFVAAVVERVDRLGMTMAAALLAEENEQVEPVPERLGMVTKTKTNRHLLQVHARQRQRNPNPMVLGAALNSEPLSQQLSQLEAGDLLQTGAQASPMPT